MTAPARVATLCEGLEPIARSDARVLILGSMPGAASLAARQYYAHPRNAFWPIMGTLVGALPTLSYPERVAQLMRSRVAVWDVLSECRRRGSLDAGIDGDSVVANDIDALLSRCPRIRTIYFNGQAAARLFRRWVLPPLFAPAATFVTLPSTSPAHAARSVATKLELWRRVAIELE